MKRASTAHDKLRAAEDGVKRLFERLERLLEERHPSAVASLCGREGISFKIASERLLRIDPKLAYLAVRVRPGHRDRVPDDLGAPYASRKQAGWLRLTPHNAEEAIAFIRSTL